MLVRVRQYLRSRVKKVFVQGNHGDGYSSNYKITNPVIPSAARGYV